MSSTEQLKRDFEDHLRQFLNGYHPGWAQGRQKQELGVDHQTLLRWTKGEANPKPGGFADFITIAKSLAKNTPRALEEIEELHAIYLQYYDTRYSSNNNPKAPDLADKQDSQHPKNNRLIINLPVKPPLFIGRDDDIVNLKSRLSFVSQSLTLIRGWPGVGKTTLVTSLAYSLEVTHLFHDGILWVALGENPNIFSGLDTWSRKIGLGMLRETSNLESVMASIREFLHDKNMLLIIDDAWVSDDAIPFILGGIKCATLITTRFTTVAEELAPASSDIYILGQLDVKKGVELIAQVAPVVVQRYPNEVTQLVSDLEGLPLALRVAGRLLHSEINKGFDVNEIFEQLSKSSKLLEARAPEDRFDARTGTTPTIDLLFRRSTDRLNEELRTNFILLGLLVAKPATFDLSAVQIVWEESSVDAARSILRELMGRGLIEYVPELDRFQIHALILMHAKHLLKEVEGEANQHSENSQRKL